LSVHSNAAKIGKIKDTLHEGLLMFMVILVFLSETNSALFEVRAAAEEKV
jgi:hypothetical protein